MRRCRRCIWAAAPCSGWSTDMLQVEAIDVCYGSAKILHQVTLEVGDGEVVALLGRNGAGKSTTIKAIMGLVPPTAGVVRYGGNTISGLPPFEIARRGLGYVPEDRRIFASLT